MLFTSTALFAQSESGSAAIEGTVRDSNNAVVAGATVTVRNEEIGLERTTSTNGDGIFAIRVLPVGLYTVQVSATGFSPRTIENIRLQVGEATSVEVILQPQTVSATVNVNAEATTEMLDTETQSTGAIITPRFVSDLPIRGRNFTEFVQLTPSIVQESDRSGLVIAGQRSINSNVAIDGADFNDALLGNQRGGNEAVFFFPQTAVREFQVVRSGANAEVGRTNAGFINVVTKSGTNDFRGEAFYFNRNRHLTSADAFGQKLNNQQNQFGGSIGGPIKRDRAFFFIAVEQNFLRVPFVVKFQPQGIPIALPPEIANLEGEQRGTNNPTAVFARTDYILNKTNTLNIQYTFTRFRGENFDFESILQDIAATANYMRKGSSNGIKSSLVTVLGSDSINELRFQIATDDRLEKPNVNLPQARIAGFGTLGGDTGRPRVYDATRFQVTDNLSYDAGRNNFRFGFDINVNKVRQQREPNIQPRYDFETRSVGGTTIATGIQNYLAGRPRRYRQTIPTSLNPADLFFRGYQKEFALFAQDKIKLSKRLSFTVGLRWESQINPQPKKPNPAIPETARIPNDLLQFQPRVGVAYDVTGKGETVVRVSAGLFTARTPATLFQRVFTDNGLTTTQIEINETTACRNSLVVNQAGCLLRGPNAIVTFPNALTSVPTNFATKARVFGFDPDFKNPRSFQVATTVEQKFGKEFIFSVGYIHNSTWNLQRRIDRNLFPPTIQPSGFPIFPSARPNPTIAQLEINESTAHSTYDGLTLSLTRRFAKRYQFQMNYTFSKTRDDDSNERNYSRQSTLNPFDLKAEAGASKQDVRHNFNFSGLIDLGYGFSLAGILITRSGFPFTALIEDGTDFNNDQNDANDRAVVDGVVSRRFAFRQPNFFNLDLRLLKSFKFSETKRIDLSVEVFNATRNANRGFGPDSINNFCTANTALATTTPRYNVTCPSGYFPAKSIRGLGGEPSTAPSTARFGGPRQVQLGVRFVF